MNKTPIWKILGGAATIAVAACAAICLNLIASRVAVRADLTEDNLYSLSDGTRKVLKDLPRDVTLKYYVSRSSADMPAMQKQYAERALDLMREYEAAGGGKVHLEVNNVKPDSDEEDWARKYGLAGQIANPMKRDEYFCGLVILAGSEEKTMPFLTFRGEQQLEYDLTKAIHEVSQPSKPKVGVISALPVFGMQANPMMMMQRQQGTPKWMAIQALESFFQVTDLGVGVTEIPSDVKTVLAIHPKNLSEQTLYALDQFVLRGGRLIAFVDPMCMADRESSMGNPMMAGMDTASTLNTLTKAWGVELAEGKVVGDAKLATALQVRRGQVDNVPVVMTLGGAQASKDDVATAQLETIMLPMAGQLVLSSNQVAGVTSSTLLATTDQGGTVNAFEAMGDMAALARSLLPQGKMVTAVKLTGTFPSAFPGGAPKPADTNLTAQATNAVPHLAKGEKEAAVVVIADADLLADMWTVSIQNMMGTTFVEPVTDNLAMLINLTEQLNGSDALIGLRSRGSFSRPFTKIRDIEERAKISYQEEYDKTVAKIDEVNARIAELTRGRKGEDKVALNNSIAGEIKKAQAEMREMNAKRRELEKQLRREVEGLEFNIKAVNLAAVPLLLIVFGIVRGILRRNRSNTPA